MTEIQHLGRYYATIRMREGDRYVLKSPDLRDLNGKRVLFMASGEIEDRPIYEGEIAMMPLDDTLVPAQMSWIASGDLTDLEEAR